MFRSIRDALKRAQQMVIEPGNIDINNRQVVINPDGTFSTEDSLSFQDDLGREVLIPTVVDGAHLDPDAAISAYEQNGQHLGMFTNPIAAESYATGLHLRQEDRYAPIAEALMKRRLPL